MASDAVDKARALLQQRRTELQGELKQVERALKGLGGGKAAGRRPARAAAAGGKRRRRRRGGTRAEHALQHLEQHPGATAPEIAAVLGIKPNYVYRVMAELQRDGKVNKQGKGYYPSV
jgi:sugar-specific transcriptional regulator TrmB